jgi:hypothetical protein
MSRPRRQSTYNKRFLGGGAAALGSVLLAIATVVVVRRRSATSGVAAGASPSGMAGTPAQGGGS